MLGDLTTHPYYPFWPYYGYFDMGPVQLPPLPPIFGMTDRTTGVVWYLTYNKATNHFQLISPNPFPQGRPAKVYPPFDGPWIGGFGWRLGVNNSHLVFDNIVTPDQDNAGGPWAIDPTQLVTVALLAMIFPPIAGLADAFQAPHLTLTPVNTK